MNTKLKLALMAGGLVTGLGLAAANYTKAATTENLPPMMEQLAEKFGLNKTEVVTYLESEREEKQAVRETELTKNLESSVANGDLTEVQKSALLAKHEELQAKREALRATPGTEKRDEMQAIRAEMDTFLKEQGIDKEVLPQLGRGRMGGRGGNGMHRNQ